MLSPGSPATYTISDNTQDGQEAFPFIRLTL